MQIKDRYQAKSSHKHQSSAGKTAAMTQPASRSGSACDPGAWREDNLNASMDYAAPARAHTKLNDSR